MDLVWFAFIIVIYHKSVHGNIYFLDPEVMKYLLKVVKENLYSKESEYDENYTQIPSMYPHILRAKPPRPMAIKPNKDIIEYTLETKSPKSHKDVEYNKFLKRHNRKVEFIYNFILDSRGKLHEQTVKYLYGEMQRIKTQRMVKDNVTEMIEYLSVPGREKAKKEVIKCFLKVIPKVSKSIFDSAKPNNLAIPIITEY